MNNEAIGRMGMAGVIAILSTSLLTKVFVAHIEIWILMVLACGFVIPEKDGFSNKVNFLSSIFVGFCMLGVIIYKILLNQIFNFTGIPSSSPMF